ncbi:MAG: FGGY family carbohydrate kinase, partial [Gemmataceae bacterium]
MTDKLVLAIDQGTTSTRAIVYDARGQRLGQAAREFKQYYPKPGWVEHDAEEIWTTVSVVVKAALAAARVAPTQLACIGLT